eukprot:Gregarina_sp_Pseudo_9__253@NODE_1160_length_1825_cov_102_493281_g1086_i0_p3_GENE_NODE_1160_length_1825_cov_102_493281_g1086_i0NODE_1160_length_1825_cov_102_493281_g1086_i0_p3_ORF_typecomplete_len110_score23_70_NODE_1160_length_1825_cov_102_493281_g1086_i013041633
MASMNPDARDSGGLSLPPGNPELREKEKQTLHGDEVLVTIIMPDEAVYQLPVKQGMEVKKVKIQLQEHLKLEHTKFDLYYDDKLLIDPISLVDGWGPNPPHFNLRVQYK